MSQNEAAVNQVYDCDLNVGTSMSELYKMIGNRLSERVEGLRVNQPSYRDF